MGRIRVRAGAVLMVAIMLISQRAEIFVLFAISAALHELGHLFAAKRLGIDIKETVFDFSGIRICPEEEIASYKKEIFLAVSGPLANLAVIGVCTLYFYLAGVSFSEGIELCEGFLLKGELSSGGALAYIALSSLLQGALNLLPVGSLDGGRISYCVSAYFFGIRAAERLRDITSALSAFVLWTVALYLMLRIGSGVGIYVFAITLFFSTLKKEA